MESKDLVKIGEIIFVVEQMNTDNNWCTESIHANESHAMARLNKIAKEQNYSSIEKEAYLNICELKLQR